MSMKTIWGLLIVVLASVGTAVSSVPESGDMKGAGNPPMALSGGNGAAMSTLTNVTTQESKDGVSITLEASGNLQYTAFKLQNPLRLVMDFQKTQKGALGDKVEVKKGVVESIRPIYFSEAEVLRLEVALTQPTQYEIIRVENNKLVINLRESPKDNIQISEKKTAPTAPPAKPVDAPAQLEAKPAETPSQIAFSEESCQKILGGEKEPISMDFQNAQLNNIFRILSEVGGFNVVLAPAVQGTTNVRLESIPWNHAIELVLKNNGLEKQCFGNVVRIIPQEALTKEETARGASKSAKALAIDMESLAGALVTEVMGVNYADIKELAKSLETLKSKRGKVTLDARTNTLVLTDVRENLDAMTKVVRSLDRPTRQVVIEARIVEVSRNAARDLGIQWGASGSSITNKEFPSTVKFGPSNKANPGFITDFAAAAISPGSAAGIGLSLGSLARDLVLDMQLTALETAGKGRILSTPKVTTVDNKEAKIQSGRKIPYQTSNLQGTSVQFVDATIELTVTPHITEDQTILMKIQAKKNAADFSQTAAGGIPTITTKEAFTEVLVQNGETTVLGGLYENTIQENEKRVPGLWKLPVLGYLFKNFSDSDVVTELLIFITPTVVKSF